MARKTKYDLSSTDGLKKLFDDSVKEMAQEVFFRIQGLYESAIQQFYNDYDPLYYQRTDSTWYGSSGTDDYYSSRNIAKRGDIYYTGIHVGPSFIKGNPYRADKDWVFWRTYNKGIHGISAGEFFGKKSNKTFMRVYAKPNFTYVKMIGDKQTMKRQYYKGMTVDRRGKYYYKIKGLGLGSPRYRETVMNNMSPTPRGIVGKGYRKLTQKKNLDEIRDEIFASKLT